MIDGLLAFLETCTGEMHFADWVAAHPQAVSEEALSELDPMAEHPAFGASVALFARLLRRAQIDPASAWRQYQEETEEMHRRGQELEEQVAAVDALGVQQRWADVVDAVDSLLPRARELGLGLVEALLKRHAGTAYLHLANDDAELVDLARQRLTAALSLIPAQEVADEFQIAMAADILVNLAVVALSDASLDPDDANEAGIGLLNEALALVDAAAAPETWATAHTNLCRAWRLRSRGDRGANLRQAAVHAREALTVRSPQQDGDLWVVTQLNYADCLDALAAATDGDRGSSEREFQRVIDASDTLRNRWPVALAHQAFAGHLIAAALQLRADDDPRADDVARRAAPHVTASLELSADAPSIVRGRALAQAGSLEAGWGDRDRAKQLHREAFDKLFPGAPSDARDAARALGELFAEEGLWEQAADAYTQAIAAAHLAFHARLYDGSRGAEVQANAELARFAAYAMARADRADEAVRVLEDLRVMEFRRRTGAAPRDLQALAEKHPGLHQEYVRCLRELRTHPLTGVPDEVARELGHVLHQIRARDGFAHFAVSARTEDISEAIAANRPLLYVDPTPHGTTLLLVESQGGQARVSATFVDVPGYIIWYRLAYGDYERALQGIPADQLPASYIGTASGLIEDREVEESLDYVLDWLGSAIAEPISRALAAAGADGVTLVPCGPVSAAPLHAARWTEAGQTHCLIDRYEVRFAPSALVAASAARRAAEARPLGERLVAVGNPCLDLPAAEVEVEHLGELFAQADIETRSLATRAFVLAAAPHASALHLATHGETDIFNPAGSVVHLSDGAISLAELAALGLPNARLVCASACQTAVPTLEGGDEAMSMATALLAAGAPAAVATLWSIHDLPTAVLVAKFYEVMLDDALEPGLALRRAQLWLRDVTVTELEAFLDGRDHLRRAYDAARADGSLVGRFSEGPGAAPWRDEVYWAAFVMHGG